MAKSIDDYTIGKISALSMYISIIFLLFQILVAMSCTAVAVLLPELGIIKNSQTTLFTIICLIFSEAVLIFFIWRHIKYKYLPLKKTHLNEPGNITPFVFNEEYLERMLNIAAVVGIAWILLMGMHWNSIRYFFIVLHGFGILFLSIFFVVRFTLAHETGVRTFASIILSCLFLYLAIIGF